MDSSRENDYGRLEEDLGSERCRTLLEGLRSEWPFMRRFESWLEFIAFMREGKSTDPRKQEALLAIVSAHAEDGNPRWQTVLLAVFWPGLVSIFNRKKRWETDCDERWQNVVYAFFESVAKIEVSRRKDRFVQRIINGTIHRFHDECNRMLRRCRNEVVTDPEALDLVEDARLAVDFPAIDARLCMEARAIRLRSHLAAGHISQADFRLLVSTRIDGKSAAQHARETGISEDAARKRRLRAEAAMAAAENKVKNCHDSCPAPPRQRAF